MAGCRNITAAATLRQRGASKPESVVMKYIPLVIAASLAASTLPSFAQAPQDNPPNNPGGPGPGMNQPPAGNRDHDQRWRPDRGWGGHRFRHEAREEWLMHAGGAHFRMRRGNAVIDIQCPRDESVDNCVNAAGRLIDKVASMHRPGSSGATNGSSSTFGNEENGNAQTIPDVNQHPESGNGQSIAPGGTMPNGSGENTPDNSDSGPDNRM